MDFPDPVIKIAIEPKSKVSAGHPLTIGQSCKTTGQSCKIGRIILFACVLKVAYIWQWLNLVWEFS
jgi:hypothetical protein